MKQHDTDHHIHWQAGFIGCGLALFGLLIIIGWIGHEPRLIRLVPGFVGVPYSSALGFLLSGLALIAAGARSRDLMTDAPPSAGRHPLVNLVAVVLPGLVVLLGLVALVEWQTGIQLGLTPDPEAVRRWFVDKNPGRMSMLDAIGFIAIGLAIRLGSWTRSPRSAVLARGLTLLAGFIGFVSVIGDVAGIGSRSISYIGPEFLAGIGFLAAGLGVRALLRQHSRSSWGSEDADKIGLIASAIMLVVASSGIIGGFAVLYPQAIGEMDGSLALSLKSRSDALETAIQQAWRDSYSFANQPLRIEAMRRLDTNAGDTRQRIEIQTVAERYKAFGFSGVVFRDAAGTEVAHTGSFVAVPELAAALTMSTPSRLLWDGGFVFHTRVNMVSEGIIVGTLEAERRLAVGRELHDTAHFGSTLDFAVCAPAGHDTINCFPFRSTGGRVLQNLPRRFNGGQIPAAHAVAGLTGIVHTRDYRGTAVIAAYQPIGRLGLVAVLKIDNEQFYSPIAQRLKLLLVGIVILGVTGTLLLRFQVLPLVRKLTEEIKERKKAESCRQKTEQMLRRSEKNLKLAQAVSQTGSWHLDIVNDILEWSDEAYRIFGIECGRKLNLELLLNCIHPEDRQYVLTEWSAAVQGSRSYDIEHRIVAGDQIKWVRERADIRFSPEGKALAGLGTVQDITEHKTAETLMQRDREQQATLRGLLEAVLKGKALEKTLDYCLTQLLAVSWLSILPKGGIFLMEEDGQTLRLAVAKDLSPQIMALCARVPSGRCLCGRAAASRQMQYASCVDARHEIAYPDMSDHGHYAVPIISGSRLLGVLVLYLPPGFQRDPLKEQFISSVTDILAGFITRRYTEQALAEYQSNLEEQVSIRTAELETARIEAERLARVKSEFLANMSHEIRTPLNAVLGFAQIGQRESRGRKSSEYFQRIVDSGQLLLGVINDILDFSKIEAGKLGVESRPFNLRAVIANTTSFVATTAKSKGLDYAVSHEPDLPEWVLGDAQRLQQILLNLLSNAVKFTEKGEVRLRIAREGKDIYFRVIDTGIGMSEEQMSRLFSPFEQADGSTTRKYGGTGLGLAISRNLASLMDGEITVDSAPGKGSSFILRLPLPAAEPVVGDRASAQPDRGRRLNKVRVLAAEDVEVNQLILEELLGREGAQVVLADNGRQALERVEGAGASSFDVVLMDVQMPVMDGHEAARRIRELAPDLPIIGLTAHAMAEEREKCLASGMADHVTKPIDIDTLVNAIRSQLTLKREAALEKAPPGQGPGNG